MGYKCSTIHISTTHLLGYSVLLRIMFHGAHCPSRTEHKSSATVDREPAGPSRLPGRGADPPPPHERLRLGGARGDHHATGSDELGGEGKERGHISGASHDDRVEPARERSREFLRATLHDARTFEAK